REARPSTRTRVKPSLPSASKDSALTTDTKNAMGGLTDSDSRSGGRTMVAVSKQAAEKAMPRTAGQETACAIIVPVKLNRTIRRTPPRPVSRGRPAGALGGGAVRGAVRSERCCVFWAMAVFVSRPSDRTKYGARPGSGASCLRGGMAVRLPSLLLTVFSVALIVRVRSLFRGSCRSFIHLPLPRRTRLLGLGP